MSRPKKEFVKVHITATIDPDIATAMNGYRNDPANLIENEKPTRSGILQLALRAFLAKYFGAPRKD